MSLDAKSLLLDAEERAFAPSRDLEHSILEAVARAQLRKALEGVEKWLLAEAEKEFSTLTEPTVLADDLRAALAALEAS